jgi:CheY-like chemotaxis protein
MLTEAGTGESGQARLLNKEFTLRAPNHGIADGRDSERFWRPFGEHEMSCPSILVVEDEPIVALDLARMALEAGYVLCGTAASGPEALALAEINRPTVALIDIRLIGRMDGIEVGRRLYEQFGTRSIFVTADAVDVTQARIGFPSIAVVAKPYMIATVGALLAEVFSEASQRPLGTAAVV